MNQQFDPRDYGSYHDGVRDDFDGWAQLAALLTNPAGPTKGNGGTMLISGTPYLATALTLPASVNVFALPGTRATAKSGVTVTVQGVVLSAEAAATVFAGAGTWTLGGTVAVPGTGALIRLAQQVAVGTETQLSLAYPGGYSEIEVVIEGAGDNASTLVQLLLRLNNDSTSGDYAYQLTGITGTSVTTNAASSAQTSIQLGILPAASATANSSGSAKATIAHPDNTTRRKTVQGSNYARYQGTDAGQVYQASGEWSSTAALTSVQLLLSSGHWAAGSVATLYGRT